MVHVAVVLHPGISVNQEVLDKANPLLIINQQSTAP